MPGIDRRNSEEGWRVLFDGDLTEAWRMSTILNQLGWDEPGAPDGAPMHTTDAIYDQPDQRLSQVPAKPVGEWNVFQNRVEDQH